MPYGPGGAFTAISLPGSFNPALSGQQATPEAWNLLLADLTGGLTQGITKNGLTTPTANLPMGGFKHTNVALATANTDYARYDQVINSQDFGYGTAGGTGDAITIALTPVITTYTKGRGYRAIAPGTNTGPVTINIDGIGAGPLRWADGTELAPGDLPSGAGFTFFIVDVTTPTAPVFHMQSVPTPHTGSGGPDLASAATVNIGASVGTYQNITGTTTITSFGAGRLGTERQVTFTGVLTLTYNATSLILPTQSSIATKAGDTARFVSLGGNNWKCESYTPIDGRPLVPLQQYAQAYCTVSGGVLTTQKQTGFTSIVRDSTGLFTCTMSTAMPDANYVVEFTCGSTTVLTLNRYCGEDQTVARTTTVFHLYVGSDNGGQADPSSLNIRVYA